MHRETMQKGSRGATDLEREPNILFFVSPLLIPKRYKKCSVLSFKNFIITTPYTFFGDVYGKSYCVLNNNMSFLCNGKGLVER